MSKKYIIGKCDGCGEEIIYKEVKPGFFIHDSHTLHLDQHVYKGNHKFRICDDCFKKFLPYLQEFTKFYKPPVDPDEKFKTAMEEKYKDVGKPIEDPNEI